MATGHKTNKKAIATLPDGRRVRSWLDAAAAQGRSTGVITTSGLFDATPSAFTSHADHRDRYGVLLEGMIQSRADLLVGGDYHLDSAKSHDPDMAAAALALGTAQNLGWQVSRTSDELFSSPAGRVLALLPEREGMHGTHGPPLETSTRWAIDRLTTSVNGFVLVVETEVTDSAAHDLDLDVLVAGIQELDRTVEAALEFAADRDDTLVVVAADHDTSGAGIADDNGAHARVLWLSDDHSATWTPMFAFGAGSHRFTGVIDNTEFATTIADVLGLEGFPQILD
jgi:alkaline phosphatase